MKHWFKLTFFIFSVCFCLDALFAAELYARVKLVKIEAIKPSEKGGDEVYLDITQYSNLGHSKTTRIPEKPKHWPSNRLLDIKDLVVWEGPIKDSEEMKVIFSVVEKDALPWDVDDLIGSAQVILKNQNGKLEKEWKIPVFEERVEEVMGEKGNPQNFIMKGDHSEYSLSFSVEKLKEKLKQ